MIEEVEARTCIGYKVRQEIKSLVHIPEYIRLANVAEHDRIDYFAHITGMAELAVVRCVEAEACACLRAHMQAANVAGIAILGIVAGKHAGFFLMNLVAI